MLLHALRLFVDGREETDHPVPGIAIEAAARSCHVCRDRFSIDTPSAEEVIDEINRGDIFSPQLHFIGQGSDLADDPAAAEEFFRDGLEQGCSSPPCGGSSPESEPDSKASRQSDGNSAKRRSGLFRSHWIYDYVQPQLDAGECGQARQDGQVPAVPRRGNMFKRRSMQGDVKCQFRMDRVKALDRVAKTPRRNRSVLLPSS